ncbi:hypothetical protein P3T36_000306 [Kitasatospora sp. MAP12-15]|uniref:DUF6011 domain-containing protein n=1 Tax=unclassified Kitasatospora TaxID=2633591 RepID=UPI002475EDD0|nr:DUF6011 domain-containing protein [Kitasatospora sp. MAP12-44]MDH6109535.1 hypothetical protein [Kitasatospora sp. MAP12-44]
MTSSPSVTSAEQPALLPSGPATLPTVVRCRRCGRVLRDPEARMLRLGKECRGPERAVRVVAGEQEPLPGV